MNAQSETLPAEPMTQNALEANLYETRLLIERMKNAADKLRQMQVAVYLAVARDALASAIALLEQQNEQHERN